MRAHEHAGDFFRPEVGAPDSPAAKRRTVAAGEGAGVGLHDTHETRHPLGRVVHLRDADRIPRAHEGASRAYDCAPCPVAVRRLREKRHPCPQIHVRLYTIHATSSRADFPSSLALASSSPNLECLYRDLDPLGSEAPEDALAQLVLDEELVGERLHLADEREVERGVAEA